MYKALASWKMIDHLQDKQDKILNSLRLITTISRIKWRTKFQINTTPKNPGRNDRVALVCIHTRRAALERAKTMRSVGRVFEGREGKKGTKKSFPSPRRGEEGSGSSWMHPQTRMTSPRRRIDLTKETSSWGGNRSGGEKKIFWSLDYARLVYLVDESMKILFRARIKEIHAFWHLVRVQLENRGLFILYYKFWSYSTWSISQFIMQSSHVIR